jgi:2-succinyl-6-hydroxy-2,4-cyclohexadiene-1-carboxylate synthase
MSDHRLAISQISGPMVSDKDPVAVLLHGFTQNRHCWGRFADALGRRFTVLGIDLPGHGDSGANDVTFEEASELVGDALDTVDEPIDTLIGYSMGGRMALRLILDRPSVCSWLVLLGATAGLLDPEDRRQRRVADRKLADRIRSEGAERFLDFWLRLPLFDGLSEAQQLRDQRLAHWGSGVPETLEHRGTGNMEPLWTRLPEIETPTLALAGDQDTKFTEIGLSLAHRIGDNGSFAPVEQSGHACHLQHPQETADAILRWRFDTEVSDKA